MRLLVTGDRNWADRAGLFALLDELHAAHGFTVVIEGEARGVDTLAREWAEARGLAVAPYPANWDLHHRAAGPIRNQRMLTEGQPDLVAAFHPDLANSKGTADMVRRAIKARVPVLIYDGAGGEELR